jgi:hypothetical protein
LKLILNEDLELYKDYQKSGRKILGTFWPSEGENERNRNQETGNHSLEVLTPTFEKGGFFGSMPCSFSCIRKEGPVSEQQDSKRSKYRMNLIFRTVKIYVQSMVFRDFRLSECHSLICNKTSKLKPFST